MNRNALLSAAAASLLIAGCSSGDINIAPSTTVQDSNNTTNTGGGGSPSDQCASYVNTGGQTISGTAEGDNCRYGANFASNILPLTVDMTIPALPNDGAHIFEASLFVGESCDSDQCLMDNGISEGGDGPALTIEAGTTVAFRSSADFLVINRGSRIIAVGRADAPITITSESDVNGTVGPEDVQQWGGMVINGFGVTNKCDYTGTRGVDLALVGECHVDSEGSAGNDENQYGGNNDGKLTKEEMQAFVGKVKIPKSFFAKTFDRGDINKDGEVDYRDVLQWSSYSHRNRFLGDPLHLDELATAVSLGMSEEAVRWAALRIMATMTASPPHASVSVVKNHHALDIIVSCILPSIS